ncbi:MAG: hypothetical protein R3A45_00630 [Bdellovibrionota bacterium]
MLDVYRDDLCCANSKSGVWGDQSKGGALIHAQENRKKLGLNHSVELVYGYYEEEIKSMLSAFFSEKRS